MKTIRDRSVARSVKPPSRHERQLSSSRQSEKGAYELLTFVEEGTQSRPAGRAIDCDALGKGNPGVGQWLRNRPVDV
jgi:hypothetical protein